MLDKISVVGPAIRNYPDINKVAHGFESVFLSEMLKFSGGSGTSASPLGGIGESHFASFLVNHRVDQISARGGIGLAEIIIRHYAAEQ